MEPIEFDPPHSMGFIGNSKDPYLFWHDNKGQAYRLHFRVLQIALLQEDLAKFSADTIRDALSNLAKGHR